MSSVQIQGIEQCSDSVKSYLNANKSAMDTLAAQAQADGNLFGEDSSSIVKTKATSEVEKLKEEEEEIQAKIAAYLKQEQEKLEREIEQARAKAKAEYNKECHGDDEEAFVQSELARNQRLQRTIEVPQKMQTELGTNKALMKLAIDKESAQVENQILLNQMKEACLDKAPEVKIDIRA